MSPADVASPLRGGEGARFARPDRRTFASIGWVLMGLLGVSVVIGVLLQVPCQTGGYELPRAGFRMCQSPVALAMTGDTLPDSAGRITSGLSGFAPLTYWFVVLMSGMGATAAEAMGLLLVLNTLAFAAMGTGVIALARAIGFGSPRPRAVSLSWVAVALVSPVVVFSIGQSLDPVGVALAVWACVLLSGDRSTAALLSAGGMLATAAFAGPLALIVLVGVLIGAARDRGHAVLVLAGFALTTGVLTLADGRLPSRLTVWLDDAVDRGSIASVVLTQNWGDEPTFATGLLVVWTLGIVAIAAMATSTMMLKPTVAEAVDQDAVSGGSADPSSSESPVAVLRRLERADGVAHLRQMVLTIAALLALSVVLAPSSSTSMSLWLLPFAALAVRQLPVMGLWFFAELGFAIAVPLTDVAELDSSIGLAPTWMGLLTLLRFFSLTLVMAFALDELFRTGRRRAARREKTLHDAEA
ncbi:hypothetical protein GCM10023159_11630 [Brevibacterium yomogidense]